MEYIISGIIVVIVLITIISIKTIRFRPEIQPETLKKEESLDLMGASKLSQVIQIPAITLMDPNEMDWNRFVEFREKLKELFPKVHEYGELTIINEYSLVYYFKGRESQKKLPILITAHMDVVPVEEGTEQDWKYPPYSGAIEEGYVWGRGTLDTKVHVIGPLQAMENLLTEGKIPDRDTYYAFGHDEERNGEQGALFIAEYFKQQKLEFEFVLDEGGCVVEDVIDGIHKPIALIGIGEKGFANIELSVNQNGGHASMPSPHSSLGILAKALCRIEAHPFKPRLIMGTREFLMSIGPYMKGINKIILANLWLFQPLFIKVFSKSNSGSALLRTTVAVTMAKGSQAPNAMPQTSTAMINCRILPGETGQDLMDHLQKVVKKLPVEIKPIVLDDPSQVSPTDCEAYGKIAEYVHKYFEQAIVAPYLVMASTDARKYEVVSHNIYRFSPYQVSNEDLDSIHGTNEKISIVNINKCISFFTDIIS